MGIEIINKLRFYSRERLEEVTDYKRERICFEDKEFLAAPISVLTGEKGVGKTVLSKQLAWKTYGKDVDFFRKVLYVSMDHTPVAGCGMYELAEAFKREGGELIIFDEVHYYKNWDRDLKTIADTVKLKTIVTGSSLLDLRAGTSGLARRTVEYLLKGMSFREYLALAWQFELASADITTLIKDHQEIAHEVKRNAPKPILALFRDYLESGYYIYSINLNSRKMFFQTLRQTVESTLQKDLLLTEKVSPASVRKIQNLFFALSQNVPYTVNYSDLQRVVDIPQAKTVKNYLAILETIGVIKSVYKAKIKDLKKPDKIYLANPNLYYAFALGDRPDIGSIREVFFLSAMDLAGYSVLSSLKGDFLVEDQFTFEIGGKRKSKKQVYDIHCGFVVKDDIEVSAEQTVIPLWLFGLL